MRELDDMDGFRIGGTVVNNLRYADDTVTIAESEEQLQRLMNVVVTEGQIPSPWCLQRLHKSLHATSMSKARYWNKCTRL